jgi:signal transduction histidine kinase
LGLYLCQLVAQAHGGALRIRRAEPGLEVIASWPATTAQQAPPLTPSQA